MVKQNVFVYNNNNNNNKDSRDIAGLERTYMLVDFCRTSLLHPAYKRH